MVHPYSCDTSVVVPPLTVDGSVILAKNSDRSANECQPLVHYPRASHAAGSTTRCQYLEIPQVATTWEIIGSAPWWLWGFEMGVNEWGVTIGNEAVYTREPTHMEALIGMDLVRLGLERARTADDAVQVIGALLEHYGQGGSCEVNEYRTYQNSFIIADATGAWVLETAGHRWVAERVQERAAISNVLTIGEPWDAGSANVRAHAVSQGWWKSEGGFAAAYRDPDKDHATGICRLDRARAVLGDYGPGVGIADMKAVLRDHNTGDLPTEAQPLPTICMHSNPGFPGETAAAMVVQIRPDRPQLLATTIWTAFGSPCLSIFRPVYPHLVGLPEAIAAGAGRFDSGSPWWIFERLQRLVARAPSLAADVRSAFTDLESTFVADAATAEQSAADALSSGDESGAVAILRALVDSTTDRATALAQKLTSEIEARSADESVPAMADHWDRIDALAGVPAAAAARPA